MSRGDVQMSVVDNCRSSGVQSLETTPKLAPEHILRAEISLLEVSWCNGSVRYHIAIFMVKGGLTRRHVFQEGVVCMTTLELRLPHVVMSIYKSWRDNLAGAVNDTRLFRWWGNMRGNLRDLVPFDEQGMLAESNYGIIRVTGWNEDGRIL